MFGKLSATTLLMGLLYAVPSFAAAPCQEAVYRGGPEVQAVSSYQEYRGRPEVQDVSSYRVYRGGPEEYRRFEPYRGRGEWMRMEGRRIRRHERRRFFRESRERL